MPYPLLKQTSLRFRSQAGLFLEESEERNKETYGTPLATFSNPSRNIVRNPSKTAPEKLTKN